MPTFFRSKDDANVRPTTTKRSTPKSGIERDPNALPVSAALVNGKYVTYTRVTRDLAVLFFTSTDSLVRRFYLIKVIETYSEALYTALWQLGINTDTFGMNYHSVINDFQQHILYGFIIGILTGMANTHPDDIENLSINSSSTVNNKKSDQSSSSKSKDSESADSAFIPLTDERIKFLVDLMRDVAYYVESKDFELGLPITNFRRYHELWLMKSENEESYYEYGAENGEEEEEDEEEEDDEYDE